MTLAKQSSALDLDLDAYAQRAGRRKGRKSTAELIGYTAAAGGLAFAGGDAMGAIVHFNTQVSVSWDTATATTAYNVAPWDINNNGNPDGALFAGVPFFSSGTGGIAVASVLGVGSGVVFFEPDATLGTPFVANLPASHVVSTFTLLGYGIFGLQTTAGGAGVGGFLNTTGYAGFAFGDNTSPGPIFGWAKVRVDTTATTAKTTVFEWAYEDCGGPIHIADTSGGATCNVPSPSTPLLALLGLGAMGVQTYRRRREEGLKRLAAEQDGAVG